jgi:PAS domain S-box-containing protein
VFENMLNGFAFCRVLFDENEKSVDFVYLEVNPAFEKLTGFKKDVIIGKKVAQAIPELKELNLELFEIYHRVTLTGKEEQIEVRVGSLKLWLSIDVYCPEKGYFFVIFKNITEHKKTDQENQRILDSLHQENNKLYSIINSINKEVWFTDTEKNITLVNPIVQKEFGLNSPILLDLEKYTESLEVFRSEGSRRPIDEHLLFEH